LRSARLGYLLGAHRTGIEAVFRIRELAVPGRKRGGGGGRSLLSCEQEDRSLLAGAIARHLGRSVLKGVALTSGFLRAVKAASGDTFPLKPKTEPRKQMPTAVAVGIAPPGLEPGLS